MSVRTAFLIAAIVNLIGVSSAFAATITPTAVTASSELSFGNRVAVHTIDGSGLTGNTHTNAPDDTMWLSDGGVEATGDVTITWDLGASYGLTGFHLWNYNESAGGNSNRGVAVADILVSTTSDFSSGVTSFLGYSSFLQASGSSADPGADYAFPGDVTATGRYVRFQNMDNFPTADAYIGVAEIQFTAIPEPTSFAILCLGTTGLLRVARRRRA
jgi:hypothetical protein